MKKIQSQQDLLDNDDQSFLPRTVQNNDAGPAVEGVPDEAPVVVVGTQSSHDKGDAVGAQRGAELTQAETGGKTVDIGGAAHVSEEMGRVQSNVPTDNMPVSPVGRPKRDRRPNVKYSADEYDLATVSASRAGLTLSGLYVKPGRLKDRGRC